MTNSKNTKRALLASVLSVVLCAAMLIGSTFAWFTDSVISGNNKIVAGNLKVDLIHVGGGEEGEDVSIKETPDHKIFDYDKWEPNYTVMETLKVVNHGNLAFKFRLDMVIYGETTGLDGEKLSDVIDVYVYTGEGIPTTGSFAEMTADPNWRNAGSLSALMADPDGIAHGALLPAGATPKNDYEAVGFAQMTVALHMQHTAGNGYQGLTLGDVSFVLNAIQYTFEEDAFDDQYDKDASYAEGRVFDNAWDIQNNPLFYNKATKTLTIPEGIEVIPQNVLYKDNNWNNATERLNVEKLVLPQSLKYIADYAFYGATNLTEIQWPENSKIISIGNGAFNHCRALTEVALPDGVQKMGTGVFANCISLEKVSGLPEDIIKNIPNGMFQGCPLVVEENQWLLKMETVGEGAFRSSNFNNVITHSFADGQTLDLRNAPLKSIGKNAFCQSNLEEVILPNTLETVGFQAFWDSDSLKKVTLPENDTVYEKSAFHSCDALTEVVIPEGCVSIGEWMFYKCPKLSTISFPTTLKSIGVNAFHTNKMLSGNVFIPANVETIGQDAFRDITNIRCAAASKPDGWHTNWNVNGTVTWGETE